MNPEGGNKNEVITDITIGSNDHAAKCTEYNSSGIGYTEVE